MAMNEEMKDSMLIWNENKATNGQYKYKPEGQWTDQWKGQISQVNEMRRKWRSLKKYRERMTRMITEENDEGRETNANETYCG